MMALSTCSTGVYSVSDPIAHPISQALKTCLARTASKLHASTNMSNMCKSDEATSNDKKCIQIT